MSDRAAEIKAAYRLLDGPRVTAQAVLGGHVRRVREECDRAQTCLLIEDTTAVVPGSWRTAAGLGPVGEDYTRGFWLHSTLAVRLRWRGDSEECDLRVIGLLAQRAWAREAENPVNKLNATKCERLSHEGRESTRWAAAVEAGPAAEGRQRIFVADRESDIYEVFGRCARGRTNFVIRLCQDRALIVDDAGGAGGPTRISEALARSAVLGRRSIDLPGGHGRKPRTAEVELRRVRVSVRAPYRPGHNPGWSSRTVNVVAVTEVNAPAGVEPIAWLLVTDLPIDTVAACWRIVRIYRARWLIEEFHKGLKTGAGLEHSQLSDARRLMAWAAVLSVVTTWLLAMKMATRHEHEPDHTTSPLTPELDTQTLHVLGRLTRKPKDGWTPRQVIRAIAGLGGFMGRKGDGEPGWLTIWRGWSRLRLILLGHALAQEKPHIGRCGE